MADALASGASVLRDVGVQVPLRPQCDESRHRLQMSRDGLQIPRPSAGVFLLVAPVVFVGVDGVAAQDVVAGFAEDGHSAGGDQDEYWGVGVGASDAEVVQAAGVAQGEFAELVDGVMAWGRWVL